MSELAIVSIRDWFELEILSWDSEQNSKNDFLKVRVCVNDSLGTIGFIGPIIRSADLCEFLDGLQKLLRFEDITASLASRDPWLKCEIKKRDKLGHMTCEVELREVRGVRIAGIERSEHKFTALIDQTDLQAMVQQLDGVLQRVARLRERT